MEKGGAQGAWRAAFRGRRIPRNKRRGALAWEKGEIFPRGAGRSGADSADAWKRIWRAVRMEGRFSGAADIPKKRRGALAWEKREIFPRGHVFAVGFIGALGDGGPSRGCAGRSGADSADT